MYSDLFQDIRAELYHSMFEHWADLFLLMGIMQLTRQERIVINYSL